MGGERLHDWLRGLAVWRKEAGLDGGVANASTAVVEREDDNIGAIVMGRNMFGGGPGPWGENPWKGWWGDNPPFHLPVFVLTHHPREPLECEGGTTFTFVPDGIEAALKLARGAANGMDVAVSGGAERRPAVPGRRAAGPDHGSSGPGVPGLRASACSAAPGWRRSRSARQPS